MNEVYCSKMGRLRPICSRMASITSGGGAIPVVLASSSAGSPGIRCRMEKMMVATTHTRMMATRQRRRA